MTPTRLAEKHYIESANGIKSNNIALARDVTVRMKDTHG